MVYIDRAVTNPWIKRDFTLECNKGWIRLYPDSKHFQTLSIRHTDWIQGFKNLTIRDYLYMMS